MRNRIGKTLSLGLVLVLALAVPAAAQNFGVGISFVSDNGGTGLTVDYAKTDKSMSNNKMMGWVADFSIHHKGFGNDFLGFEGGVTGFLVQGGLRMVGQMGERAHWHVQGTAGFHHASASVSAAGLNEDICDAFNLDCDTGASSTGVVFMPAAGVDFDFSDTKAFRAQLGIPISSVNSAVRFWLAIVFKK